MMKREMMKARMANDELLLRPPQGPPYFGVRPGGIEANSFRAISEAAQRSVRCHADVWVRVSQQIEGLGNGRPMLDCSEKRHRAGSLGRVLRVEPGQEQRDSVFVVRHANVSAQGIR